MRGFQAASFTLSDKTETILKNFSISYSMPSCIVLRSKIILMATGKKQYPDCKSARHNLFNCQSMTVRTAMKLCSINCIIFTHIYIVRILRYFQITAIWNIRKIIPFRRCRNVNLTVSFRFLICFLRPISGQNIICFSIPHKIHWYHGKLQGSSSLQEQNHIIIWNIHKRA